MYLSSTNEGGTLRIPATSPRTRIAALHIFASVAVHRLIIHFIRNVLLLFALSANEDINIADGSTKKIEPIVSSSNMVNYTGNYCYLSNRTSSSNYIKLNWCGSDFISKWAQILPNYIISRASCNLYYPLQVNCS